MLLGPSSPAGIRDSVTQEKGRGVAEGQTPTHVVPFPADLPPRPATVETGLACPVKWEFPPSLLIVESRATKFRVLAFAEAGDTVTADHLLQMATLTAEHKPTVLGIPGRAHSIQSGMHNSCVTEFACPVQLCAVLRHLILRRRKVLQT